jgi:hypothetical protein
MKIDASIYVNYLFKENRNSRARFLDEIPDMPGFIAGFNTIQRIGG